MIHDTDKTTLFCIEHFKSNITDREKVDTDYVWDIFHQATNLICEVEGCNEKARWIINGLRNKVGYIQ